MPRVTQILRKGQKALEDLNLLKVLQSEIAHELSTPRFQDTQNSCGGDFVVDWDSPQTQDVVLRRKCESGEEVAVSALLGLETLGRTMLHREALMKVCIRKPGLSSILQFDCRVADNNSTNNYEFNILNAYYLQSPTSISSSAYRGPLFRCLDPQLQEALKEYLISRGIGETLINFLLLHLHKKEQGQYVKWLHQLESMVGKGQ